MAPLTRALLDPTTYRRLAYLVSAIPLGLTWFVALVTVWSLCLGLLITPFVIPLLIAMAFMTRGFAAVEAEVARALLGLDTRLPSRRPAAPGFWAWLRGLFDREFWRAQAYLLIRWFAGFPAGVAVLGLLGAGLSLIFAPAWVPFVPGGAHLGFWRPHTFAQSLALVPIGVVLAPAAVVLASPLGAAFRPIASSLLPVGTGGEQPQAADPRRSLQAHAALAGVVVFVSVLIWAITSRGYFWPIWPALPLGVWLGINGWSVMLRRRPMLLEWFRGSRVLAMSTGVGVALALFFTVVWAITGHSYFWPVWPMLAILLVLGAETAATLLSSPGRAEMVERIETLQSTRAGAVDAQESELRRIERDLHDGAQARLVALGMSLGMAERKLAEDPERVSELLAEAREGAEHALRELRDLVRGIHPPVLADRGLQAALVSLASASALRVTVGAELPERPPPAVESAAYFVAAEALANAAKHARAERVDIRAMRVGDTLELEVRDDGRGGANPNGTGLGGLRSRVEAIDGTLTVISPAGGPTTVRAEFPCG